jgi:hypothetical protein
VRACLWISVVSCRAVGVVLVHLDVACASARDCAIGLPLLAHTYDHSVGIPNLGPIWDRVRTFLYGMRLVSAPACPARAERFRVSSLFRARGRTRRSAANGPSDTLERAAGWANATQLERPT